MILLGCIVYSIVITHLDEQNVGSGFGEGEGNGFPDAPGAAGDERGMAFEGEHSRHCAFTVCCLGGCGIYWGCRIPTWEDEAYGTMLSSPSPSCGGCREPPRPAFTVV